ncbi:XRE family transcriptional regulator [Streptomyces sp. NPDC020490]|uniref:XRE family transcriptional regulator n=1 Tax=Streptomyces sp. NPDC020490 TaxID=3365078 RepID=UPI003794A3FD
MAETKNEHLAAWIDRHDMSIEELVDAVNDAIHDFTGRQGTTSERTGYRWLAGKSRWPQERQRIALERVTGLTATDLGFVPRGNPKTTPLPPAALPEDPSVHRRRFVGAATGTVAAVAAPLIASPNSRPQRVGTSDVIRLRDSVETLVQLDAARGGHTALERAALAGADEALSLQQHSATQRVRQRLYAVASDFVSTAAWSMIDAGQLDAAGKHLDRALTLAGMSQDPDMSMQVWNLRAMLARQRDDYGEAIAAAQAMQTTTIARRSPLHASLAHARTAISLAHAGDRRSAALRSLGRAEDALGKVDLADPRPTWIAFYGPAELYSLTAIVRDVVGDPAEAEAASHRALGALPHSYRRNRGHTTARLALAQLHQGDVEQACATSAAVFEIMAGDPLPGRMRRLLGDFHRDLITLAPPRVAHEWTDRYRTEWSTPA